jgi:hypothetical protein
MGRKKTSDAGGGLPKSVMAALPTGFAEEAEGMDETQLRDAIVEAEENIRSVEQEKQADEKLQGAKELVKDLGAGYREATKAQRAKIAYSLHLLDGVGKAR